MIRYSTPTQVKSELQMVRALLWHFDWQANPCFWNSHLLHWESDFLKISKSGYLHEVEIKTDIQDWRSDHLKDKFSVLHHDRYWKWLRHFSYAVPADLLDKHGIPDNLPDFAGVMSVRAHPKGGMPSVEIVRPAKAQTKALPLTSEMRERLYRSAYFRGTRKFLEASK